MSRLEVFCGCMFAGKTAALISALRAAQDAGRRVRAFKHGLDTRYGMDALVTHDGRRFPAQVVASTAELGAAIGEVDVVGVDEIQFFGRSALEFSRSWLAEGAAPDAVGPERILIVAGIDHDAWGRPFPPLPQLKELANRVEVFTAPCRSCGAPARYSQRMIPITDHFMVGGPEAYQPRCADCFVPLADPAPAY